MRNPHAVVQCLERLAAGGHRALEPTTAAYDGWYARTQAEMRTMVWASPHIEHEFSKNEHGVVNGLGPWRLVDSWAWTKHPDPADFVISNG